jgi:hypothetical protein
MWIQPKYASLTKSKRKGKLGVLTLPKVPKGSSLVDSAFKLNIKPKSLDFVKGNNAYILSDEIGICDKTQFSFFFTDDFMCICVLKGLVYVKDEKGAIYSINQKNKIVEYEANPERIIWKSMSDLHVFVNYVMQSKYNLIKEVDKRNYANNLLFSVEAEYVYSNSKLFTIRFTELSEVIGGSFNFEIKEKIEEVVSKPFVEDEKDIYTDNSKEYTKSKKYSMYDMGDDDEDYDDVDELSGSMHEISIFNDYSSLDEPV